ncbi:hypothetical protein LINGRAHAP2_LOCUS17852, partial [Linum grandiflorum]
NAELVKQIAEPILSQCLCKQYARGIRDWKRLKCRLIVTEEAGTCGNINSEVFEKMAHPKSFTHSGGHGSVFCLS